MEKTTLYIPTDIQAGLKLLARQSGRSRADIIREALRDYLNREEPPPLLSMGIASNATLHGDEVDDWLRANWRPEADWEEQADPASDPL